jgi:hypothetical protein
VRAKCTRAGSFTRTSPSSERGICGSSSRTSARVGGRARGPRGRTRPRGPAAEAGPVAQPSARRRAGFASLDAGRAAPARPAASTPAERRRGAAGRRSCRRRRNGGRRRARRSERSGSRGGRFERTASCGIGRDRATASGPPPTRRMPSHRAAPIVPYRGGGGCRIDESIECP